MDDPGNAHGAHCDMLAHRPAGRHHDSRKKSPLLRKIRETTGKAVQDGGLILVLGAELLAAYRSSQFSEAIFHG